MSTSYNSCPRATATYRPSSPTLLGFSDVTTPPPTLRASVPTIRSSESTSILHHSSQHHRQTHPINSSTHGQQQHKPSAVRSNGMRDSAVGPQNDVKYFVPHRLPFATIGSISNGSPVTLPQPSLPSMTLSKGTLLMQHIPQLPLPVPRIREGSPLRHLSSSHSISSRPPTSGSIIGHAPTPSSHIISPSQRNSANESVSSHSPVLNSRKDSQASIIVGGSKGQMDNHRNGATKHVQTALEEEASPGQSSRRKSQATATGTTVTPQKSRRVRTGCLTCRERHLKCDEGLPDCLNCRKGNRECKRGLRLNFIDIQTKEIPHVPDVTEWNVSFLDESRLIASEYIGGIDRYPLLREPVSGQTSHDLIEGFSVEKHRHSTEYTRNSQDNDGLFDPPPVYATVQSNRMNQPASQSPKAQPEIRTQTFAIQTPRFAHRSSSRAPHGIYNSGIKDESHPYFAACEHNSSVPTNQNNDASSSSSSMAQPGSGRHFSIASVQANVGNSPGSIESRHPSRRRTTSNAGIFNDSILEGLPTPPSDKNGLLPARDTGTSVGAESGDSIDTVAGTSFGDDGAFEDIYSSCRSSKSGEREYLNSPDEVRIMQVFVENVGVWMDSFDKDKHFSSILPYVALKSPMMLNAFLACGVKHLTLVDNAYKDEKSLFYYDTATMQLLRSLQNPDRDNVECATTAVVLNVYEIMSEKLNERMNHNGGARALIRECGWNAQSKGIGAACFWLNIGMEVLSCLTFNWTTAWDPDEWGLDTGFTNDTDDRKEKTQSQDDQRNGRDNLPRLTECDNTQNTRRVRNRSASKGEISEGFGILSAMSNNVDEELWVHRIFYIVAKVANFRATAPRFQEPSPHDEQVRLQYRFSEWKKLKGLCDRWNRDCPRSMRPLSYLFPSQASAFPNIWLIKRTAVIGRLFYHTAMVLLHQVNPVEPYDSAVNLNAQRHHALQVCGIVAHTKDRGVSSIAIRSLAISAFVLREPREQDEVVALLQKIADKIGWCIGRICFELQQVWGRNVQVQVRSNISLPLPTASTSISTPPDVRIAAALSDNVGASPGLASLIPPSNGSRIYDRDPSFSSNRLPLPESPNIGSVKPSSQHLRMQPIPSIVASRPQTISCHSPAAPMLYHLPHKANPLMHADFRLPDHPYKAFYKPPNDATPINSNSS